MSGDHLHLGDPHAHALGQHHMGMQLPLMETQQHMMLAQMDLGVLLSQPAAVGSSASAPGGGVVDPSDWQQQQPQQQQLSALGYSDMDMHGGGDPGGLCSPKPGGGEGAQGDTVGVSSEGGVAGGAAGSGSGVHTLLAQQQIAYLEHFCRHDKCTRMAVTCSDGTNQFCASHAKERGLQPQVGGGAEAGRGGRVWGGRTLQSPAVRGATCQTNLDPQTPKRGLLSTPGQNP